MATNTTQQPCEVEEVASLGFVYRFAAVYGFGKPGKSAAAAAVTLITQGEMCTTKTKKTFWEQFLIFPSHELIFILIH